MPRTYPLLRDLSRRRRHENFSAPWIAPSGRDKSQVVFVFVAPDGGKTSGRNGESNQCTSNVPNEWVNSTSCIFKFANPRCCISKWKNIEWINLSPLSGRFWRKKGGGGKEQGTGYRGQG